MKPLDRLDSISLKNNSDFSPVWNIVEDYIKVNGNPLRGYLVFLQKMLTIILLVYGSTRPQICLAYLCTQRGFSIMEELEDTTDDFSLVLRKWDNRILKGIEYRCLIFESKLEGIINKPQTHSINLDLNIAVVESIKDYVDGALLKLPTQTLAMDIVVIENEKPIKG